MSRVAERHERIARAVKTQPSRPVYRIAQDFGVSIETVYRACRKFDILTGGRPVHSWGEKSVKDETWLHVGDVLMARSGGRDGYRQVAIIGLEYHDDLTVSYVCRPVSEFRQSRTTTIHERTVKSRYVRIKTTERMLPVERFMAWTFAHSN